MLETILSTPETALGAVIAGILVLLGVINRKSFAITAKTIGNSVVTAKILKYLKSEFSDDVDKLLDSSKLPFVVDVAKQDERTLAALCKLSTVATVEEIEAVCKLAPKADMVGIEETISIFTAKIRECKAFGTEIPDQYKENVCKGVANACINGKE